MARRIGDIGEKDFIAVVSKKTFAERVAFLAKVADLHRAKYGTAKEIRERRNRQQAEKRRRAKMKDRGFVVNVTLATGQRIVVTAAIHPEPNVPTIRCESPDVKADVQFQLIGYGRAEDLDLTVVEETE